MNGSKMYKNRDYDVLTKDSHLESLISFKNFPVFMGCVETPVEEDIHFDMNWVISPNTGMVQINPIIDEKLIYMKPHWSGTIGGIWKNHHAEFANFVKSRVGKNILEIGSSHGMLYDLISNHDMKFTIVEPNYIGQKFDNVKVVADFFHSSLDLNDEFDTIIHSHFFEHITDYDDFFKGVKKHMKKNGIMLFSVPNIDFILNDHNQFCLNFEHTVLLKDVYIKYFMNKNGFEIVETIPFQNHSNFYCALYTQKNYDEDTLIHLYEEHKRIIQNNYNHRVEDVKNINKKIYEHEGQVYLYSGHVFSQYLINLGLNTEKITCILDNDKNKIGKRLYGTKFTVKEPAIITKDDNPAVILRSGIYNDEIKKQLISLNPNTKFL